MKSRFICCCISSSLPSKIHPESTKMVPDETRMAPKLGQVVLEMLPKLLVTPREFSESIFDAICVILGALSDPGGRHGGPQITFALRIW
jgi:hypothetical protein